MLSLVTRLLREAHLMGCLFVSTFQIENTIKFNTMLFYAFLAVHNKRALYSCVGMGKSRVAAKCLYLFYIAYRVVHLDFCLVVAGM